MCRESCRRVTLLTIAGLVATVPCAIPLGALAEMSEPGYTLVATCVTWDKDLMPLPNVRILLHPDSTVAVSDAAGDFVIQWSGRPGWITLTAPPDESNEEEWCVRTTLPSLADHIGKPYIDLGSINITPGRRVHSTRPELPHGASPKMIQPVSDPSVGEPIEGTVRYRIGADIHGNVMNVEWVGSDDPPTKVAEAVEAWIKGMTWRVGQYTICSSEMPFSGDVRVAYVWKGGSWHFDDAASQIDRSPRREQPAAPN